jgi:hypothetical protein
MWESARTSSCTIASKPSSTQKKTRPARRSVIEKDEDYSPRQKSIKGHSAGRYSTRKDNSQQDDRRKSLLEKFWKYDFEFLLAKQPAGQQQSQLLFNQLLRRHARSDDEQTEVGTFSTSRIEAGTALPDS